MIEQIKQLQNQESELNENDSMKRKEINKLNEKIKSLDAELNIEKKERQSLNIKYSKDTEKSNEVLKKLQEKLKLASSIDGMVTDLKNQVEKYSKKGEKKDSKIAQLNQEILNYKNTYSQVEQALEKLESDNVQTLMQNQDLLKQLNSIQSKQFNTIYTQTDDTTLLSIEPLIRSTKIKQDRLRNAYTNTDELSLIDK